MGFQQGHKLSGSRKGIPNKTTKEIRDAFQMLVEDNLDNMKIWLSDVGETDPERALEILIKLSEFIVPKLSRTDIKAEVTDKSIVINLKPIENAEAN